MSPVRYEMGFYIPEDVILHSHRRENLKSYTFLLNSADFVKLSLFSLLCCPMLRCCNTTGHETIKQIINVDLRFSRR
jgi:hypothetical protein